MKGKLALVAGAAVGYVLGTRAGREQYERLKGRAQELWQDPRVQGRVTEAEHRVTDAARAKFPEAQAKITDTARNAADAARTKLGREKEAPAGAAASGETMAPGAGHTSPPQH